jgi:acetoin utilization deacetylase AcuC-like enzyme
MTTAYLTNPAMNAHNAADHVEHAGRLEAVTALLADSPFAGQLDYPQITPATDDRLLEVHTPAYLDTLLQITAEVLHRIFGGDTYVTPQSEAAARLAAGAAIQAAEAVATGRADNALVALRPPGHHALAHRPMGFCLYNNIALAAQAARRHDAIQRILIVDYDVHHGNGTQDFFYEDPDVLFVSTHQSPFYPGTGHANEIGLGPGRGTTLNVPLRAGYGDDAYRAIYRQIVWPAARRFQPDLILVSAGFDCHWHDPLGGMTLTLTGYDRLTRELIRMAQELCAGRIVFLMEGGYNLDVLAHGMLNITAALLGEAAVSDPLPLPAYLIRRQAKLPALDSLLAQTCALHDLPGPQQAQT